MRKARKKRVGGTGKRSLPVGWYCEKRTKEHGQAELVRATKTECREPWAVGLAP
jgi:hypothetical protein